MAEQTNPFGDKPVDIGPEPNPIRPGEFHITVRPKGAAQGAPLGGAVAAEMPSQSSDAAAGTANPFGDTPAPIGAAASMAPSLDQMQKPGVTEPVPPGLAAEHTAANMSEASAILGGPVDPQTTMPPAQAFMVGRQLGMKNWGDTDAQFKQFYPDGQLVTIGGFPLKNNTTTYWYKEDKSNPDEPYKQLGTPAQVGELANLRNLANVASVAIPMGNTLGGIARAGGLTGLVTGAGEYADYLTNRLQGFSADVDQLSALKRAGTTSLESAIPMYVTAGLYKGLPILFNASKIAGGALRGLLPGQDTVFDPTKTAAGAAAINTLNRFITPEARTLNQEFIEGGLHPLSLGQIGPAMVQTMFKQASGTSGAAGNLIIQDMNTARQKLEQAIRDNPTSATNSTILQNLVDTEKSQVMAELPIYKMVGKSASGIDMQEAVRVSANNARTLVRQLGSDAAEKAEDTWVGFPMQPLQDAAKEVRTGVLAPGKEVEDSGGNIVSTPVQLQPPTSDIKPFLGMIDKIGDRLGTITGKDGMMHNAFDQFIALRDGLYDLMTSAKDNVTRQQAYTLWNATHEMAGQAESELSRGAGQATTKFQGAYKKFIDTYKDSEDYRTIVSGIINARDPGNSAMALVQPGRFKTLNAVKNSLVGTPQEDAWNVIVDGYRSQLQQDLGTAGTKIKALQGRDPDVINTVMSKAEQDNWIKLSEIENATKKSVTGRLAGESAVSEENAIALAQKAPKAELANYVAKTGGPTGAYAQSVRGGVYQDIMNKAKITDPKTGVESISPLALNEAIRSYTIGPRRDALDSVMTQADWGRLEMLRKYSAIVGASQSQVGGALQAGEIAAELHNIYGIMTNPARFGLSVLKMMNNKLTGNILASPVGGRLFDEAVKTGNVPTAINLLTHAASFVSQDTLHQERQRPPSIQEQPATRLIRGQ